MINFFRKIRQRLLTENKASKYLLYAIGEIVLVVIGILIALQINNWNQQRIAFEDEQVLLKILKIDFTNRLKELEFLNTGRQNAVNTIEQLMFLGENPPEFYKEYIIDSLLATATTTYRFNEKFSTMDMLFNSGKINTLSNDSLKFSLSNWPTLVEEMLEEQRLIVTNYEEIVKVLDKYVSLRDILQRFSWSNYEMPKISPGTVKKDYQGLLKNRSFENLLASKRFLLIINIYDAKIIIKETKKIIQLLDNDIKE
ncbi:MAG: DUF6090 family protein [Maribacter sp.]|nr:DUF6090 family protein [Maribacter sp.]